MRLYDNFVDDFAGFDRCSLRASRNSGYKHKYENTNALWKLNKHCSIPKCPTNFSLSCVQLRSANKSEVVTQRTTD
jgi:hypothetical protein